jgi:hypothetical protein
MIDWPQFLKAYGLTIFTWTLLPILLALPNYSIPAAIFGAIFLLFYSYAGHVFAHSVSTVFPLNYINMHVSIHHDHLIVVPRWLNLIIEAIVDFLCFYVLILIQSALGIHWISTSAILGAGFLYVFIHIFDFSLFGNEQHKEHHEKTFCNYDPEFFDTLFETRCSPDTPYRDLSGESFHALCAFVIAFALKYRYKLE